MRRQTPNRRNAPRPNPHTYAAPMLLVSSTVEYWLRNDDERLLPVEDAQALAFRRWSRLVSEWRARPRTMGAVNAAGGPQAPLWGDLAAYEAALAS